MKRVLIISYYFPPAGGVSVQRVLKLVKYLPQFGWEPVVLTVKNGSYPVLDHALSDQLGKNLKVHRVEAWEPFKFYAKFVGKTKGASTSFSSEKELDWKESLSRTIRGNFFIPDARKGWVKKAIKEGSELVGNMGIDAMISSGPPHSTHLIARGIKRKLGIPWISDFRDLWTEIDYKDQMPQTKLAAGIDARLEASVLDESDITTTVSPSCKTSLISIDPSLHCEVIPNGFDPEDFESLKRSTDSKYFTLTYAGTLGPTRNPSVLWEAISELRKAGKLDKLRIKFFGSVDASVRRDLDSKKLETVCQFMGSVSHKEALSEMFSSDLLLLLINQVAEKTMAGITPGKMFEYMATGVPILGLGSESGDAAEILRSSDSGRMFSYGDLAGASAFLENRYSDWRSENVTSVAKRTEDQHLSRFNRISQSKRMAELLHGLSE